VEHTVLSRGLLPGYHRIAISPILLRGTVAGAWRFSYLPPGAGPVEGLDVLTPLNTPGGRQFYQLMATAPVSDWLATRAAFGEVLRTFSSYG
jgi:hypothetical protein